MIWWKKTCTIFAIVIVAVFLVWGIQFGRIHRIYGLEDILEIITVARLPSAPHAPHCKEVSSDENLYRCLPNVFLIGASKAGTTSFLAYLLQYPHVFLVKRRIHAIDRHSEIHRFDRSSFPLAWKSIELLHEWASSPITGSVSSDLVVHYTPHYLHAPTVPFDMREFYPKSYSPPQFVILLRNPVERMLSSYWFKNSHLFHQKDKGSALELVRTIEQQQLERHNYEICMLKYFHRRSSLAHAESKPTFQIENDYHSKGFSDIPILSTYCSVHDKSPSSTTCKYLYVLYQLMSALFSCKVDKKSEKSNEWKYTDAVNRKRKVSSTQRFSWKSRCTKISSLDDEEYYRDLVYEGLQTCYGEKEIRSRMLGHQHVDKSIYVDQIFRWWLNFPSTNQFIFLSSAAFFEHSPDMMDAVYNQLLHKIKKGEASNLLVEGKGYPPPLPPQQQHRSQINFEAKRLHHPNHLSDKYNISSEALQNYYQYFDIYNDFLFEFFLQ